MPTWAKAATETVLGYELLDVLFSSTVHLTSSSSMGKKKKKKNQEKRPVGRHHNEKEVTQISEPQNRQ